MLISAELQVLDMEWCHGDAYLSWTASVRHGMMSQWWHGMMSQWWHGMMSQWWHGMMSQWWHGMMSQWWHGMMSQWWTALPLDSAQSEYFNNRQPATAASVMPGQEDSSVLPQYGSFLMRNTGAFGGLVATARDVLTLLCSLDCRKLNEVKWNPSQRLRLSKDEWDNTLWNLSKTHNCPRRCRQTDFLLFSCWPAGRNLIAPCSGPASVGK